MSQTIGVSLEETNALKDAQDYVHERGSDIILYINDEGSVERDIYNAIKKSEPEKILLPAWPIIYSPSIYQVRKAGIEEGVDVLITFAVKDFTDNNLMYKDIDNIRWKFVLDSVDNEVYTIKDKNRVNRFSHTFLNIVLGLTKK